MAAGDNDGYQLDVDEDGMLLQDEQVKPRDLCATCRKWRLRCLYLSVLLLSSLILLSIISVKPTFSPLSNKSNTPSSLVPGQDIFRAVSKLRVKFDFDRRYSGPESNHAWKALYPSLGLVEFKKGQETELGPPVNVLGHQGYSVSAFHQLHCLDLIRHEIYGISMHHGNLTSWHVEHCFDYLRQALMCNADTALEHATEKDGQTVEGWDVWHECRDWTELRSVAERHWPFDDQQT